LEEQIHEGGETGAAGKYQLVSVLSEGEDRDEGDQENEGPRKAEIDFGLGVIEALSKGVKVQEIIGEVAELVECEKELKDYVGCENEFREDGERDNILALVTRTEDAFGGSEMLDLQPLAVLEEQLGVDPMSTKWVVERVRGFCKVVGMSCPSFEEKLMDLFNDIETHRYSDRGRHDKNLSAKFGNRRQCEVKRLECSVNYDGKGGQSSRMSRKGRVGNC
jgi:hypothetical protein